jgi:hypothetical protein
MLGPYRESAILPAELNPERCVPRPECQPSCPHMARAWRASPTLIRALTGAATLLLLVASASIAAIAWTVTTTILEARGLRSGVSFERAEVPSPALASLGAETHNAEVLWARAERFAAHGPLTLVRATAAPGALAKAGLPSVLVEPHDPGGVEIGELAPGSQVDLLGLRRGDVITAVNGFPFRMHHAGVKLLSDIASPGGGPVVVEFRRGHRAIAMRVEPSSS